MSIIILANMSKDKMVKSEKYHYLKKEDQQNLMLFFFDCIEKILYQYCLK